MSNLVWADPALFKLGGLGADVDVVGVDEDVITWFKLHVAAMEVGVALLSLLSRLHAGFGRLKIHVPVTDEGIDGERGVVITDGDDFVCEGDGCVWMSSVNHVEWCEASRGGTVVVEGEFGTREMSVPVGLIGSDVVTDVGANVSICIFRLSVRLWVIRGAEVEKGSQLAKEFSPKLGSETWVAVGNECFGDAMETEDVILEDCCKLNGAVAHLGRNDVHVFRQTINEDTDGVVTLGGAGQTCHEVDGDGVPTESRNGERLKKAGRNERGGFVELAAMACTDVGGDVRIHARPPNMTSEDVHGGVFALMTREGSVVCVVQEAVTEVLVVRDA